MTTNPGSYVQHVAALEQRLKRDDALRNAVGGEFIAIGKLEAQLLRSLGLTDGHCVVDVGCGSGRLACQLAAYPGVRFFGFDVVPQLIAYATELCQRPDWQFACTNGTAIPVSDATADFVCFFSVFTHLTQDDIFRYLREAHRVLKPGGRVVLSFLQFDITGHWETFVASVEQTRENSHLNQFFGPDEINAWARHAGFRVNAIHRGDTQYIPLTEPIVYESGAVASGYASLGQSVAVLEKVAAREPRSDAPLLNVSFRGLVPPGGTLHGGFVVGGNHPTRLLVRAVGPSLAQFGVSACLREPRVVLRAPGGDTSVLTRAEPGDATGQAFAAVGAFPLTAGNKDVAALVDAKPGAYALTVQGGGPADAGEVLIEVYQA